MSASLAKQQSSSEHAGLNLSFLAEKNITKLYSFGRLLAM